jgi:ABC-type lipoprotein release transport system permease subunit
MNSILHMALRNLFRQKRRTFILGLSIALSTAVLLFGLSFVEGVQKQLFENLLVRQTGHFVLHHPDYQPDASPLTKPSNDYTKAMHDDPALEEQLLQIQDVRQAVKRLTAAGSLFAKNGVSQATVTGLQLLKPEPLSHFLEADTKQSAEPKDAIYLAKPLRDELGVAAGDTVTLVTRNQKGETVRVPFQVAGSFEPSAPWLTSQAYISLSAAQSALAADGKSMEWLVYMEKGANLTAAEQDLTALAESKTLRLSTAEEVGGFYAGAMLGFKALFLVNLSLIFIVVAMGMTNMMLMSSLERMREIGTLLALGTPRLRVAALIVLEAVLLASLAGGVALLISFIGISALGSVGIDLKAEALTYTIGGSKVYPVLTVLNTVITLWAVLITIFLAALYPAAKACRWSPVRALRGGR